MQVFLSLFCYSTVNSEEGIRKFFQSLLCFCDIFHCNNETKGDICIVSEIHLRDSEHDYNLSDGIKVVITVVS